MLLVRDHADGISVETAGWKIEHSRASGGVWTSLSNPADSRNLLQAPATAALAVNRLNAGVTEVVPFSERNESSPYLHIERNDGASVVVVSEGAFRDGQGQSLPVGFRRRTEYLPHGLIWTTLELMSDVGCDGIVELCALNLSFESRFERLFARLHPTQAGLPELFGAHGWFSCSQGNVDFQSRFTPLQLTLCSGANAFEILLPSELAAWDHALKSEAGLGQYLVLDGRSVSLSPYAVHTCPSANFRGNLALRAGFVLPDLTRAKPGALSPAPHRLSPSATLSELNGAAVAHRTLALMHPVAGDPALSKLVEAGLAAGANVLAGISLNELATEDACFPRVSEWMHSASPVLGPVSRRERGDGSPAGAMLCLKSGWFDELKRRIDAILNAANWSGLYLTDTAFHPCRHTAHGSGPFHSDVEGYLALLKFCRERTGGKLLIADHSDGNVPTIYSGNVSDVMLVDAGVPDAFCRGRCQS